MKDLPLRKCKICPNEFRPTVLFLDNKKVDLRRRSFCLTCSPLGGKKEDSPKSIKSGWSKDGENSTKIFICDQCGQERYQKGRYKTCHTCRAFNRRNNQKKEAIALLGGKCVSCGYCKSSAALDFHHKDPNTKLFNLSTAWHSKSLNLIRKEIEKCELLCANCHREQHKEEQFRRIKRTKLIN